MIKITEEIRAIINEINRELVLSEDEYINPADGLIHCRNCGGHRQIVMHSPLRKGYSVPRCICPCQKEADRKRAKDAARRERMERIRR